MNKIFYIVFALMCTMLLYQCTAEVIVPDPNKIDKELELAIVQASPNESLEHFILPDELDYDNIPHDPQNPINAAKVSLGMYLFYETAIGIDAVHESGIETYSCASCHIPEAGFKPGRFQGIADGAIGFGHSGEVRIINEDYTEGELDVQGTRPLSLLNVAFVKNTFWNGHFGPKGVNEGTEHLWSEEEGTHVNHFGFEALEAQNIEGLKLHRMRIDKSLADELGYTSLFDQAFKDWSRSERYTNKAAAFAISAYLRTLLTNQAPFQRWLKGEYDALTREQKEGAKLFFGKAGCYNCHYEPNLGSVTFHALGVNDLNQHPEAVHTAGDEKKNLGRGAFTRNPEDDFKFKVPQLYNLKNSPFYFHGSSKETLEEVVDYFNEGIPENDRVPQSQISELFRPLELTETEKSQLIEFLKEGLFDPNINRYVPPYVFSQNCFPNNDPLAREQSGCE